jgi:hypothetical protein
MNAEELRKEYEKAAGYAAYLSVEHGMPLTPYAEWLERRVLSQEATIAELSTPNLWVILTKEDSWGGEQLIYTRDSKRVESDRTSAKYIFPCHEFKPEAK